MTTTTTTTTRKSPAERKAELIETRKACTLAAREAHAAVREARSAVNRATHAARPVRVSASAVKAITGESLADGATARGTIKAEHAQRYVSVASLTGRKATFTREGDTFLASVPSAGGNAARVALTRAESAARKADASLARARAAVKAHKSPRVTARKR